MGLVAAAPATVASATAATATAVAAAAAAAATTAVAAAAAAAATAAGTVLTGPGFVDGEGPAAVLLAVERGDGRLGLVIVRHFDEPEALAAAGVPVVDDLGGDDLPVLTKQLFQ